MRMSSHLWTFSGKKIYCTVESCGTHVFREWQGIEADLRNPSKSEGQLVPSSMLPLMSHTKIALEGFCQVSTELVGLVLPTVDMQ
jgi:hypothetical protein